MTQWQTTMEFMDALGNKVCVDDWVIYNLSGGLAKGKVLSIVSRTTKRYVGVDTLWKIEIQHQFWPAKDKISIVRNSDCIVGIKHL